MSGRELLRVTIRTLAPPGLLVYILWKFYDKNKDKPGFKATVEAWRKLWNKLTSKNIPDKLNQEQDKKQCT